MTRLIPLTVTALVALAVFAGTASAKGPFKAELSGGNLDKPVVLDETFQPDAMNSTVVKAPASLPDVTYTLSLVFVDEQSAPQDAFATYTYIPATGGDAPLLRWTDGTYTTVSRTLSTAVESVLAKEALAAPATEEGGTSLAWWAIPSAVGLGVLLLGGSAAAVLRGRRRHALAPR